MFERLDSLVMYVGSAALAAFLAACLSSSQADQFSCHTSGANGAQRCEINATLSADVPDPGRPGRVQTTVDPAAARLESMSAAIPM